MILKSEAMRAERGFDQDGDRVDLPAERRDDSVGLYVEYGLTDRLTLVGKGDWQSGEDAFVDYEGRGPLELGVAWQAWRGDRAAVSVKASYADGGEGRNAGYAAPGQGERDWELRVSAGRSFGASTFAEIQAARRWREGLPDEDRLDATLGARFARDWLVLGQVYAGVTEGGGAQWMSLEGSVVRDFGPWSVQAGWRQAVAGREIPAGGGPVIALWRRF